LNSSIDNIHTHLTKSRFTASPDIRRVTNSHGGLSAMRDSLLNLQKEIAEGASQGRLPDKKLRKCLKSWIETYEKAAKASIGLPTVSDSVTTQREAPKDIPTAPLSSFQLLSRTCYLVKLASSGTTAGGFYATLNTNDLNLYIGTNKTYRVKRVTSWTAYRADGTGNSGFAGVQVPGADGSSPSDSIIPIWSENYTPIGQGYAGIVTEYPSGDFPYYSISATPTTILNHFTSLGGTGGITGVPVVFHVQIECLI
jgi:hypothetical protein